MEAQTEAQVYGQVVTGPAGSGKTSYCKFFKEKNSDALVLTVNLDPAVVSDEFFDVSVCEIVTIYGVMEKCKLGPNGSLMHCFQVMVDQCEFFAEKIVCLLKKIDNKKKLLLFDCPGQLELTSHEFLLKKFLDRLVDLLQGSGTRLKVMSLFLVDVSFAANPYKFLNAVEQSLSCMFLLELPHVNLMSKMDDVEAYQDMITFNMEFYYNVVDLKKLFDIFCLNKKMSEKEKKFNNLIIEAVSSYTNYLSFLPFDRSDEKAFRFVFVQIERAVGLIYDRYQQDQQQPPPQTE